MAEEEHLSRKDLGLSRQEYTAMLGTIELGKVVKRGLGAQQELTGDKPLTPRRKALALRDYLSMKALAPHVETHQENIQTEGGPLPSIQLLMGNHGFSARAYLKWRYCKRCKQLRIKQASAMRLPQGQVPAFSIFHKQIAIP